LRLYFVRFTMNGSTTVSGQRTEIVNTLHNNTHSLTVNDFLIARRGATQIKYVSHSKWAED